KAAKEVVRSSRSIGAHSDTAGMSATMSSREEASAPKAVANRDRPIAQASIIGVTSRPASPPGASNTDEAGSGPAEAGRSPAPTSRRRDRAPAITRPATITARETVSGHHRRSTYTRVCWAHAKGENQD